MDQKYTVKVDNGADAVSFEFLLGASAISFAQVALEHLIKHKRSYHEGGVTISVTEIKPEDPDDDKNNDEEDE